MNFLMGGEYMPLYRQKTIIYDDGSERNVYRFTPLKNQDDLIVRYYKDNDRGYYLNRIKK